MPTEPTRTLLTEEQFEQVEDLPVISTAGEVNVEEIAGLDPDLILVPNMIEPEVSDPLREVAPSYIYTHGGGARGEWDSRVAQIADVVNRTEEAEALAEELAEKHADIVGDLGVSMFGAWEASEFSANGSGSMLGKIITPVGLQFADGVEDATHDADSYEQSLSTEEITSTFGDSDVIFHSELLDGSETEAVLAMPTFQALPAAQDDHVFGIGKSTIAGYTDANYVLDRLDEILTELGEE